MAKNVTETNGHPFGPRNQECMPLSSVSKYASQDLSRPEESTNHRKRPLSDSDGVDIRGRVVAVSTSTSNTNNTSSVGNTANNSACASTATSSNSFTIKPSPEIPSCSGSSSSGSTPSTSSLPDHHQSPKRVKLSLNNDNFDPAPSGSTTTGGLVTSGILNSSENREDKDQAGTGGGGCSVQEQRKRDRDEVDKKQGQEEDNNIKDGEASSRLLVPGEEQKSVVEEELNTVEGENSRSGREIMTESERRPNFSALTTPSNGIRHVSPLNANRPGAAKKLVIKNFKGEINSTHTL